MRFWNIFPKPLAFLKNTISCEKIFSKTQNIVLTSEKKYDILLEQHAKRSNENGVAFVAKGLSE